MQNSLVQYFRCPETFDRTVSGKTDSSASGYFRFGKDSTCFGSYHAQQPSPAPAASLHDALDEVVIKEGKVYLPFDPSQVIENLHHEAYVGEWREGSFSILSRFYYFLRPAFPVFVRRHLQMLYLRDWTKISFPSWPVDCSVDIMQEQLLLLSLRAGGVDRIPFIWFWPNGSPSCAIMTHDIETQAGCEYCPTLMDIDDAFGIKASFQVIPEERYQVSAELLEEIRRRGFEICVHDLNHDGHLYKNREQFLERAAKINAYRNEFRADGFRAAVLYRKQVWFDALRFSFDMSVPNVAHLDPQRGGCCTVMPYFLGDILEIPVTATQDYTLFNILSDYSIDLWKRQAEIVMQKHGCVSFIVHPEYIRSTREQTIYKELLTHLDLLRRDNGLWIATPGEVNRWWRQRAALKLVQNGAGWQVEGPGYERARIAYATEEAGRLVLKVENPANGMSDSLNANLTAAHSSN